VRASACATRHQRGDTDSVQPVILLTVTARQAEDCVSCAARLVWYSTDTTSSRKWRDTTSKTKGHLQRRLVVCLTQALQHSTMQPPMRKSYTCCARPAAWYVAGGAQAGAHTQGGGRAGEGSVFASTRPCRLPSSRRIFVYRHVCRDCACNTDGKLCWSGASAAPHCTSKAGNRLRALLLSASRNSKSGTICSAAKKRGAPRCSVIRRRSKRTNERNWHS
jgi:hypothetical protein